ncbi:unnamed protein product [Vitrella brassicaformis CCMP3155]|uniref:Uncharacterized protein n=2 Tax=Vitrella brassicaformis TaxID=1169539 RepID=A0A0G4GLW1_VITBC|nr:unnamed protein product [Vitrella brassicaformis CCMP3155]|mmetsp:Transcript_31711/g.78575  ORF Transcript_31711/g.78575 Transcript_31711/m.78575 type:complete len:187 (+) Transcript_31711:200-760(+)|eukprot:CEM31112.1 unnamed protein product [Vitrella brassicaformis CCMP3155]
MKLLCLIGVLLLVTMAAACPEDAQAKATATEAGNRASPSLRGEQLDPCCGEEPDYSNCDNAPDPVACRFNCVWSEPCLMYDDPDPTPTPPDDVCPSDSECCRERIVKAWEWACAQICSRVTDGKCVEPYTVRPIPNGPCFDRCYDERKTLRKCFCKKAVLEEGRRCPLYDGDIVDGCCEMNPGICF